MSLLHRIAVTKIKHVGPVTGKLLISHLGSAEAIWQATEDDLKSVPQVAESTTKEILDQKDTALAMAEAEIKFIEKNEVTPLFYLNDDYPRRLKYFDQSPIILYYKGTANLNPQRTVGIVGTRKPSEYGVIQCEKLVEGLKSYGVSIISGLAFGIDTTSHRKSVETGQETIGVLGHGLDMVYPASNRKLSQKMLEHGGLLTEFGHGSKPDRENFPMRNRIIAALSDSVVIAESAVRGGSIITATFADAYNKDVFAIPGRVTDEMSAGPNKLIKTHKAHMIESAADIAYIMRWDEISNQPVQRQLFVELSDREQSIVDYIRSHKELPIDGLQHLMQIPASELSSALIQLEFKGIVRPLPGKRYMLH